MMRSNAHTHTHTLSVHETKLWPNGEKNSVIDFLLLYYCSAQTVMMIMNELEEWWLALLVELESIEV